VSRCPWPQTSWRHAPAGGSEGRTRHQGKPTNGIRFKKVFHQPSEEHKMVLRPHFSGKKKIFWKNNWRQEC
jgi:hypothetical protein